MNFDMIAYILLEFSKNFLLFPHLKKECHTHWLKPISENFLLFSLSSNLGKRKSQMPFNQKTFTFYLQVFRFAGQGIYITACRFFVINFHRKIIKNHWFSNIEKNETAPFCAPTPTPNPLAPVESTKTDLQNPQNYFWATSEVPPRLLFLKSERK